MDCPQDLWIDLPSGLGSGHQRLGCQDQSGRNGQCERCNECPAALAEPAGVHPLSFQVTLGDDQSREPYASGMAEG
jgi:hypothetical protein